MRCGRLNAVRAQLAVFMSIHIAITRRVRPGCEAEFQRALREFFQASFAHGGVLGATMIVPPPGSDSREFGILRSFANERFLCWRKWGWTRKPPMQSAPWNATATNWCAKRRAAHWRPSAVLLPTPVSSTTQGRRGAKANRCTNLSTSAR